MVRPRNLIMPKACSQTSRCAAPPPRTERGTADISDVSESGKDLEKPHKTFQNLNLSAMKTTGWNVPGLFSSEESRLARRGMLISQLRKKARWFDSSTFRGLFIARPISLHGTCRKEWASDLVRLLPTVARSLETIRSLCQ